MILSLGGVGGEGGKTKFMYFERRSVFRINKINEVIKVFRYNLKMLLVVRLSSGKKLDMIGMFCSSTTYVQGKFQNSILAQKYMLKWVDLITKQNKIPYVDLMVIHLSCSSFLVSVKRVSPAFADAMIPALLTKESVSVDFP